MYDENLVSGIHTFFKGFFLPDADELAFTHPACSLDVIPQSFCSAGRPPASSAAD